MIFIVSYFLLCGNFSMFSSSNPAYSEEDERADLIKNEMDHSVGGGSPSSRSSRRVGKLVPKKAKKT